MIQKKAVVPSDLKNISQALLYATSSSYRKDWKSILHSHSFCEIFYITKGAGALHLNDSVHSLKKDDLVIINPRVLHTETSSPDMSLSYIVLGIENLKFSEGSDSLPAYICNCSAPENRSVLALFSAVLSEKHSCISGEPEILNHILSALFVKISCMTEISSSPYIQQNIPRECVFLKEYIDNNFNQSITLDTLAELVHQNKYYICHSFSEAYGTGPIKYLFEKRLLTAKQLLATTDFSVSHIAEMSGFSSAVYFSQIFKQHTGLSPKKFRSVGKISKNVSITLS